MRSIKSDLELCLELCEKEAEESLVINFRIIACEALPYWLERVQELEAQAATMRKIIELVRNDLAFITRCSDPEGWSDDAWEKLGYALSTTAGKEILERIERLEAVAEAAKQMLNSMPIKQYWYYLDNLRKTLTVLEGEFNKSARIKQVETKNDNLWEYVKQLKDIAENMEEFYEIADTIEQVEAENARLKAELEQAKAEAAALREEDVKNMRFKKI